MMAKTVHRLLLVSVSLTAALLAPPCALAQEGNAARGAKLFRQKCASCHVNKGAGGRGPNLMDIVGGQPTAEGFTYKSAMVFMSWSWTLERLDRFLQDPTEVSGANPASRVSNKKDRADVIAYLKTLRSPEGTPPVRGRSQTKSRLMSDP